jgi:hypothetical protein
MINIGKKNRWALIQCLREEFERQLEKIPQGMIHNFTISEPYYEFSIKVDADRIHRVLLEKENEDLKKRLERLEQKIEKEISPVDQTVPTDWWHYHHGDCRNEYRGCHPTKCPKNQYEKTGIWKLIW